MTVDNVSGAPRIARGATNPRSAPRRATLLLVLAALAWATVQPGAAAQEGGRVPKALRDLTGQADYIFRGTVVRPGSASLAIVEADDRTAVVRIDEVLKVADTLDDFTGREVTIFLRTARSVRSGDQRIFFTSVNLLAESLGVVELGRRRGNPASIGAGVREAQRQVTEQAVRTKLGNADLVVSGRVVATRPASVGANVPRTEHDPQWWDATLEVASVVKGQFLERTVTFRFPGSLDVMWARSPKAVVGAEGTWLLRRQGGEGLAGASALLVAQDAGDLLSSSEAAIAERLVNP